MKISKCLSSVPLPLSSRVLENSIYSCCTDHGGPKIEKCVVYYNFTKFHQNQMKNKKSFINSPFFCSEFQSVNRIVKIVHSEQPRYDGLHIFGWYMYLLMTGVSWFCMSTGKKLTVDTALKWEKTLFQHSLCSVTPRGGTFGSHFVACESRIFPDFSYATCNDFFPSLLLLCTTTTVCMCLQVQGHH